MKIGFPLFLATLIFLSWNIGADLPNVYHADEPHHLNIAAHFSTGDLNPHDFKYPTLWKYALALMLGIMFAVTKLLGLARTGLDFASMFVHEPTIFYLGARMLAAGFFAGAVWIFYRTGERFYDRPTGFMAALFLATGPSLWFYNRYATMISIMIFFIALAIYFLHGILRDANRTSYIWAGLAIGLATSSHYIAAPLGLLIVTSHFLSPRNSRQWQNLLLGCGCIFLGFFLGSPFFLFDLKKALSDIAAMGQLHVVALGETGGTDLATRQVHSSWQFMQILKNAYSFLDPLGIGTAGLAMGLFFSKTKKKLLEHLAWGSPLLVMAAILAGAYHGNFYRYALSVYVPLVFAAAVGFVLFIRWVCQNQKIRLTLMGLPIIFFAWQSSAKTIALGRPDTRTLAKQWINENIEQGASIFLMDPYNCPQLRMAREQIAELQDRTTKMGHPRRHYYSALLHNHPGNGYRIYYMQRGMTQIEDTPERVERSYQAQDIINIGEDPQPIWDKGIKYLVVYKDPYKPEFTPFLFELEKSATLAAAFPPQPGLSKGWPIYIYRHERPRKT